MKNGFEFESGTDTEVIPKLMKYLYDIIHQKQHILNGQNGKRHTMNGKIAKSFPIVPFCQLVEETVQELVISVVCYAK